VVDAFDYRYAQEHVADQPKHHVLHESIYKTLTGPPPMNLAVCSDRKLTHWGFVLFVKFMPAVLPKAKLVSLTSFIASAPAPVKRRGHSSRRSLTCSMPSSSTKAMMAWKGGIYRCATGAPFTCSTCETATIPIPIAFRVSR